MTDRKHEADLQFKADLGAAPLPPLTAEEEIRLKAMEDAIHQMMNDIYRSTAPFELFEWDFKNKRNGHHVSQYISGGLKNAFIDLLPDKYRLRLKRSDMAFHFDVG